MPLKKLWNSLCGRSEPKDTAAQTTPIEAEVRSDSSKAASGLESQAATKSVAQPVAKAPPRRSVLSMIARGEHDGLIKAIRHRNATSILEIGVGDGSRMPAILTALVPPTDSASAGTTLKAAVVDQFEMGTGAVAIRDYHRQLNGLAVRPAIFPEPISRGLVSVANRLGKMDIVLIDAAVFSPENAGQADELQATIGKVLHAESVVMSNESGQWSIKSFEPTSVRRAA